MGEAKGKIKEKERLRKSNNSEYWIKKISNNIKRDVEIDKQLSYLGWTVIRFWGKDILKNTDKCINEIEDIIFDLMINNEYIDVFNENDIE